MRVFVAIDIEPAIRDRIFRFMDGVRESAPDARWVDAQSFHLTLKFIGERSPAEVDEIKRALAAVQAPAAAVNFRGTGFFPTPRAARVFWVRIEADNALPLLASRVDEALLRLRIPREERPFSPHLTLARGGDSRHPRGGSGRPHFRHDDKANSRFVRVQEKLATLPPPEFGAMTATEFFLYESKLSPAGAHYTKLARFPLHP
jgi:2'-5' RNA ligase